ncbi:hypothetical protein FVER53590_25850 [Fusarium verticillioides]|nr:hypothetical protein FVER53590_25850 [Fusarium verticillioides]
MWFLTAGEYHVNHNTNNWNGSTVNELEERHLYWVVGTRDCTEYCESTSPIDEKIFYLEHKPILYSIMMEDELLPVVSEYSKSKFCSFLDLCVSSMNPLSMACQHLGNVHRETGGWDHEVTSVVPFLMRLSYLSGLVIHYVAHLHL